MTRGVRCVHVSAVRRPGLVRTLVIAVLAVAQACAAVRAAPPADAPYAVAASAGPQAGARVDARVTRVVDGERVTLPGAVVPALQPGDVVDVRFPDYTRPPARANYHVNVAFITEAAPQRWLFERSGPPDRLFAPARPPAVRRGRTSPPPPAAPGVRFTYGGGDRRGIPIFFIVPEDGKTRGMDGVRDYVDAHPTDFKNMAESSNDAADRYVWFSDFLGSLADGSIDPIASHQRVETIATALGVSQANVDACYAAGGSSSVVAACIQSQLASITYQTNIEAPTQAQFLGGAVGAVAPVQLAAYLIPLLSVWKLFAATGHREYEYLPTALTAVRGAAGGPGGQLLMGLKVPSLRPPAAYSDALFFTIGDPQAVAAPPVVVNAADPTGMCAAAPRVTVPLHLDRTSAFVHDTRLVVTPDAAAPYTIPVDPRDLDVPPLAPNALHGAADGAYTLRLDGRFGFDPIRQPATAEARIVVPRAVPWSIATLAHHPAIAGGSLDLVASSPAAPCLGRAELQIGDRPPLPLEIKRLSDRRVALHASLAGIPPGEAHVRFSPAGAPVGDDLESDTALAILPSPARVAATPAPTAFIGDRSIALRGSELETATGVRVNGTLYAKDSGATANAACFSGAPVGGGVAGQTVSAQLVGAGGTPGEVFALTLAAPRPVLRGASVVPDAPVHFSSEPLTLDVDAASPLPPRVAIRVRREPAAPEPCDGVTLDAPGDATLPASASFVRSADTLAVTLDAAAALGDLAFGRLQIRLVDTGAASASDWLTLPGRFVRSPSVARIECPPDAATPCTLLGTGLETIAGVAAPGRPAVAPDGDCTSDDPKLACLRVPHQAAYELDLIDGGAPMPVSPALIGPPRPPPSAAPAAH